MARIAGVNIPENKHVEISLTHIFGIGRKTAQNICIDLKIDYTKKISDLSEEEIEKINNFLRSQDCKKLLKYNHFFLENITDELFETSVSMWPHDQIFKTKHIML